MQKKRKRKFVIWLQNHTDRRDDSWQSIWAHSEKEAWKEVEYDTFRFSKSRIYTAADFFKFHGMRG